MATLSGILKREGLSAREDGRLVTNAAVLVVVIIHVWLISAGWMVNWPKSGNYYDSLSEAFLHGHTYLRTKPDPVLLALPDPYNTILNAKYRVHDAVLYDSRYYFYWGPVPAVLLMPVRMLMTGDNYVGDHVLVFVFTFGIVLFSAQLLMVLRERFFPDAPPWTAALGVLAAGLSTHLSYLLGRPAVYEAAISGGQCFLLAGIYFAVVGFEKRRLSAERMLAVGACWALAVGSRLSLAPAVLGLTLLVCWRIARASAEEATDSGPRPAPRFRLDWPRLARLGALGAPLAIGAALMVQYNVARFGRWYESGQRYQLANYDQQAIAPHIFAAENVWPNVYSYLFRPIHITHQFPYLFAMRGGDTFPSFVHLPPWYDAREQVSGILVVIPFVWFALLPLARLIRARRQPADRDDERRLTWVVLALLTAALLGFIAVPFLLGCTMRYLVDLMPPFMILASIGLWQANRSLADKPTARTRLLGLAIVLATLSATVGVLLGVTGYHGHFQTHHPQLFEDDRSEAGMSGLMGRRV